MPDAQPEHSPPHTRWPDGLQIPEVVSWPIFPFEGDMSVRKIEPYFDEERVRNGDPGGEPCFRCDVEPEPGDEAVWSNDDWALRRLTFNGKSSPFPAYMLETVAHLDIDEITESMAAEMGVLTLRINNAIMALDDIGRVHLNRWGDGAAHFHVWFLGRPKGAWQFSGYTLPLWGFTLPGLSEAEHRHNDAAVARHLEGAEHN